MRKDMGLMGGGRMARVTISDVAADAGVSRAAVSKVMRSAYGVSNAMRSNVLASIEKLGYRPSLAARGMRGRTYTVGVLLVEIGNPFLVGLIDSISTTLRAAGYQLMIGVGEAEDTIELSMIESMIAANMDGLILVAPRISGGVLAEVAQRIPIMAIGHHEPDATTFDTVNSDDFNGARMAVEALIAIGRRSITMLSLERARDDDTNVTHLRERGYLRAMHDAGLADHARVVRTTEAGLSFASLEALVGPRGLPAGLFCWSDIHAVAMVNLLKTRNIRVPEDLAIIGYDNSAPAAMPLIDLSSIDQNAAEIGCQSARILLSRIVGEHQARHLLIPPTLVHRSSH